MLSCGAFQEILERCDLYSAVNLQYTCSAARKAALLMGRQNWMRIAIREVNYIEKSTFSAGPLVSTLSDAASLCSMRGDILETIDAFFECVVTLKQFKSAQSRAMWKCPRQLLYANPPAVAIMFRGFMCTAMEYPKYSVPKYRMRALCNSRLVMVGQMFRAMVLKPLSMGEVHLLIQSIAGHLSETRAYEVDPARYNGDSYNAAELVDHYTKAVTAYLRAVETMVNSRSFAIRSFWLLLLEQVGFANTRFFLFHRIVCPPLCVASFPPGRRRQSIICAKILQTAANAILFGRKESYMMIFNPFLGLLCERIDGIMASLSRSIDWRLAASAHCCISTSRIAHTADIEAELKCIRLFLAEHEKASLGQ